MSRRSKEGHILFLLIVGLVSWLLPGGGYFLLRETKRAIIILVTIVLVFCTGLYVGSIGVIDTSGITQWYVYAAQIMASPTVAVLGYKTVSGNFAVYGRPNDIGQIYTSTAGWLNLLCIVNAVYLAHLQRAKKQGSLK